MFIFAAVLFTTQPLFSQTSTNLPPKLSPAYPEMSPTIWEQYGTAMLTGGFIALAFMAVILWQLFKSRPQPAPPPETIAREALARLQRQPEDGKVLSESSLILRRYVGAVFGFPGGEMTTTEFSATVASDAKIGPPLASALASFLQVCDRDKFVARNEAPPLNAATRALELVELVKKRLAMVGRTSSQAETDGSSVASPHRNAATK